MARNKYLDHLRSVALFADLPKHELEVVDKAATELNVRAGDVLIREGTVAHEMVVVVSGELEVTRNGEHVADLGPGDFAGEMALLTHAPRHATVTAKTDATLLHIDGRQFSIVLDEAPQIAVKMLPILAGRVIEASTPV
ncbi:MAG TPA: cyclic nucleotide-binding domain-containing protein [Acidimicrobiales bacterium]|jgi:CRP-like cAMP-binding protein